MYSIEKKLLKQRIQMKPNLYSMDQNPIFKRETSF